MSTDRDIQVQAGRGVVMSGWGEGGGWGRRGKASAGRKQLRQVVPVHSEGGGLPDTALEQRDKERKIVTERGQLLPHT